jgi:hypothetical protein
MAQSDRQCIGGVGLRASREPEQCHDHLRNLGFFCGTETCYGQLDRSRRLFVDRCRQN